MPEWIEEENRWGGVDRYYIDAFGHKVHEGTIDGIPESKYDEFVKRQKESVAEQIRQDALKKQTEKFAICPLKQLQGYASVKCTDDCIMKSESGCGIVTGEAGTGAMCPLSRYKCSGTNCAWYSNGCKLKSIFKK